MGFLEDFDALKPDTDKQKRLTFKWMQDDPDTLFAELREHRPIFQVADKIVLLTKYDDVVKAFHHPNFSASTYNLKDPSSFILSMDEGVKYTRHRAILERVVKREDYDKIRAIITEEVYAYIKATWPTGKLDIPALARHVPLRLVERYFGLLDTDTKDLAFWNQTLFDAFRQKFFFRHFIGNDGFDPAQVKAAAGAISAHLRSLIGKFLRAQEGAPDADSLLGRMLTMPPVPGVHPPQFARKEIGRNLIGLMNGMVENTTAAVTYALDHILFDKQKEATLAVHERNDTLLLQYIWEALRFDPAVPVLSRITIQEHVLAPETKRAAKLLVGTHVFLAVGSAMMDGEKVSDPKTFKHDRPEETYLHFGYGMHRCFGDAISNIILLEISKNVLRLENVSAPKRAQKERFSPKEFTVQFKPIANPVQTPLTAVMKVKAPHAKHAVIVKQLVRAVGPDVVKNLEKVGTVHFARFVFLENDTRFAIITSYDGPFEAYINDFIEQVGDLFDLMLQYMENAPPTPVRHYRREFVEYVRSVDITPEDPFFSAYPDLTVQNILHFKK